jgi:hypothetical protein
VPANLYSVILDFRGGTYVAQVIQASPAEAVTTWAAAISEDDALSWKLDKGKLLEMVSQDNPIALRGHESVWCLSGNIGGHFALINVIQTVPASTQKGGDRQQVPHG